MIDLIIILLFRLLDGELSTVMLEYVQGLQDRADAAQVQIPSAEELVREYLAGRASVGGYRYVYGNFSITLDVAGRLMSISSRLALDLYDRMLRKGRCEPELILPLFLVREALPGDAQAALPRLKACLARLSGDRAQRLAVELINAGVEVSTRIEPPELDADGSLVDFGQVRTLKAALRQKHPRAAEILKRLLTCRDSIFTRDLIPLLSLDASPHALDLAYEIGSCCPRLRAEALAVLLRAGDERSVPLLRAALQSESLWGQSAVKEAIEEVVRAGRLPEGVEEELAAATFPGRGGHARGPGGPGASAARSLLQAIEEARRETAGSEKNK